MADRKAKTSKVSEEPEEIVELDKDERWQARLEEARARREIALREKASAPRKKQRRKPWEEEPGDDPDDFEIKPIIQKKPADEKTLDLADRLEAARKAKEVEAKASPPKVVEAPKPEVTPEPEPEPEPAPPVPPKVKAKSKLKPKVVPEFKSKARNFDDIIPPGKAPTVAPAPMPKKPRRGGGLVIEGAPDVIDLAKRYGSTLKPPVNVTQPFDTVPREVVTTPPPEPMIMAPARMRSRRPFGLGLAVLAFSLIPLSQVAPPLEKGPAQPPSPFFALPPALGLTTSMVWPVQRTQSGEWVPGAAPVGLGLPSGVEASPFAGAGSPLGLGPLAVEDGSGTTVSPVSELPGTDPVAPTLSEAPAPDAPGEPLVVPTPKPRPEAPIEETEAPPVIEESSGIESSTVVDRSVGRSGPELLDVAAPDARPRPTPAAAAPVPPANPLRVTILVPSAADLGEAEGIASDTQARGHDLARVLEVDLSISSSNVRYFHAEDRAEAARLAEAYGAEIKDFTWFRPTPERGTTEIWLSGSGNTRPSRPVDVRSGNEVPDLPPRTITLIRKKPTLLERILTGAQDEIEIVLPDPSAILEGTQTGSSGGN